VKIFAALSALLSVSDALWVHQLQPTAERRVRAPWNYDLNDALKLCWTERSWTADDASVGLLLHSATLTLNMVMRSVHLKLFYSSLKLDGLIWAKTKQSCWNLLDSDCLCWKNKENSWDNTVANYINRLFLRLLAYFKFKFSASGTERTTHIMIIWAPCSRFCEPDCDWEGKLKVFCCFWSDDNIWIKEFSFLSDCFFVFFCLKPTRQWWSYTVMSCVNM